MAFAFSSTTVRFDPVIISGKLKSTSTWRVLLVLPLISMSIFCYWVAPDISMSGMVGWVEVLVIAGLW